MLHSYTEPIVDWRAKTKPRTADKHRASSDSVVPLRKGHTKSRTGCQQCKSRKIKCGEERPSCANCSHRGSPCEYAARSAVGKPAQPSSIFVTNLGASDFVIQNQEIRFCLREMRFFHHFLMNVAHPLPLGNRKVWANDIPQISHQHEYLMHAMLALGAAELNVERPDSSVHSEVLKHRGRAIVGLQKALNDESSWTMPGHSDAILATCYILVAQTGLMADATDDFNIAVRGCALVEEKLRAEKIQTAFQLTPNDMYLRLGRALKAAEPRLRTIPTPDLALDLLHELMPLVRTSSAFPFAQAVEQCMTKLQHEPVEAYIDSLINFSQWYHLALGIVGSLREPNEAAHIVVLEGMLLANMIWMKVLIPLILWPRRSEKTNPFPGKALLEASFWIEAIAGWVPLDYQHLMAWSVRVTEAIPHNLLKITYNKHTINRARSVAGKLDILYRIDSQAHTMLASVLRIASELASWFEGHAMANISNDDYGTHFSQGNFGPVPVPLGQLNHSFSRVLRTKRGPEPPPVDASVLDEDHFPFVIFSRLG